MLRGKGVIEEDAQERWVTDYRSQATLTLDEFIQVVIHCVVYLNNGRVLPDGQTAAQKWVSTTANLLDVPAEELQVMALPRMTAKLTRKGFRVNRLLSLEETSKAFKVSIATIRQWEKQLKERGNLEKRPLNRPHKKIDPEKLRTYVMEHPDAYQKEMAEAFGCSTTAIQKALKRLGISEKKDNALSGANARGGSGLSGTNCRHPSRENRVHR